MKEAGSSERDKMELSEGVCLHSGIFSASTKSMSVKSGKNKMVWKSQGSKIGGDIKLPKRHKDAV